MSANDALGTSRFWFQVASPEASEDVKAQGIEVTERVLYLVKLEDFSS